MMIIILNMNKTQCRKDFSSQISNILNYSFKLQCKHTCVKTIKTSQQDYCGQKNLWHFWTDFKEVMVLFLFDFIFSIFFCSMNTTFDSCRPSLPENDECNSFRELLFVKPSSEYCMEGCGGAHKRFCSYLFAEIGNATPWCPKLNVFHWSERWRMWATDINRKRETWITFAEFPKDKVKTDCSRRQIVPLQRSIDSEELMVL